MSQRCLTRGLFLVSAFAANDEPRLCYVVPVMSGELLRDFALASLIADGWCLMKLLRDRVQSLFHVFFFSNL